MVKSKMEKFMDQLEKTHGPEGIFAASDALYVSMDVISTGSPTLNDALGPWGLPRGRIIQYAGKESSGKTFMSLLAIREWQNRGPDNWALFIDAEQTFSPEWAAGLGLDLSRIMVWKTNDGAHIFRSLCGVPSKDPSKPKAKEGLLDQIKAEGGSDASGLGLIVLDSVAAVMPPLEVASDSGQSDMALMGRFMPKQLRRITPLLSETNVSLIAINQVRVNPGQMYGNPETTTGGSAWKHFCSVMIHFARPESKDSKIFDADENQIGHFLRARIDKNKIGVPYVQCEFGIEYENGLHSTSEELRALAVKYGVVQRPNTRSYTYKDKKWSSKDEYATAFNTEEERESLLAEIKEAKANGVVVVPTAEEGE